MEKTIPMRPHAILAYCAGYDVHKVEPFVASWKRHVPSARLLIFHTNLTSETIQKLMSNGVEFVDIERYWPSPYAGITLRMFMWRDYLQSNGNEFSKVLLADIRDVIFQSDPFDIELDHPVIWASEDKTLRSDPKWNLRWLQELFGSDHVDTFADEYASCCGTTIGSRAGIQKYLEDLCSLIENTEFDRKGVYEQGFHNYLVHKLKPQYGNLDLGLSMFATLGTIAPQRISLKDDAILLDGRKVPIVHQWDRHGLLVEHTERSASLRLG